jgi:hypothetical protein
MLKKSCAAKWIAIGLLSVAGISAIPTESMAQSMTFTCVASNGARTFRASATAANPGGRPNARARAILAARQDCGAHTKTGNYCVMAGCRPY